MLSLSATERRRPRRLARERLAPAAARAPPGQLGRRSGNHRVITATKAAIVGNRQPRNAPGVSSRQRFDAERDYGDTWMAGWSNFMGHVEYWRFYQSTQFLYLGSVREVTNPEWTSKLRQTMHLHADAGVDIDSVPGFLSLTNSIHTITEFFEFAARLAQAQVYTDPVTIDISIRGIGGFMLAADENKMWSSDYVARQPDLRYEKTFAPAELVASAAEHAIRCAVWLFERFGWLKPNIDAIRTDQQKLLTRRG